MNGLVYSYDQLYLGNTKNVTIFKYGNSKLYEEYAIEIIKYAIEHYLGWTPQMAYEMFDDEVIQRMKLANIVEKIKFPAELNPKRDYFYVISACYPTIFPYHKEDSAIVLYDRVLTGKMERLPKNFFSGSDGIIRLKQCFRYLLSSKYSFMTYDDIYEYFADAPRANEDLVKYNLFQACTSTYDGVPLDMLHACLEDDERNESLYQLLRFELFINRGFQKRVRKQAS